jgi:predicted GH43/DUF377 family glycosyl hydrolase
MLWERALKDPWLVPQPGTLATQSVTTPEVMWFQGRLRMYVGAVRGDRERIASFDFDPSWLTSGHSYPLPEDARIAIDVGPERFDCSHVFDPAAIDVEKQVYLYYSAIAPEGDTLGLAISQDGTHFAKCSAPVQQGRAPGVVRGSGTIHLFHVRAGPGSGYAIYSSVSGNGVDFSPSRDGPTLDIGRSGEWDGFEVTTPRPFKRAGATYMLYAGESDRLRKDKPRAFGLARSFDLMTWERYPGNPVFRVGDPSAWDDGAIWFGTVLAWQGNLYLLYEGGREKDLNGQGVALTQIGLACVDAHAFDRKMMEWARDADRSMGEQARSARWPGA